VAAGRAGRCSSLPSWRVKGREDPSVWVVLQRKHQSLGTVLGRRRIASLPAELAGDPAIANNRVSAIRPGDAGSGALKPPQNLQVEDTPQRRQAKRLLPPGSSSWFAEAAAVLLNPLPWLAAWAEPAANFLGVPAGTGTASWKLLARAAAQGTAAQSLIHHP